MKHITNPRTIRAKARRMQADVDASAYTISNGFTGNSTGNVCASKMVGAMRKKLSVSFAPKTFKRWGEV